MSGGSAAAMILFYSDHCQYCDMLLSSVKRYDPEQERVRLVNIDHIRVPPAVHTVPALMLLPSKQLLFGRAAMDYLLLPNRGALVGGTVQTDVVLRPTNSPLQPGPQGGTGPGPMAFEAFGATSMYETLDSSVPEMGPWETIGNLSGRPPGIQQPTMDPHPSSGNPRLPPSMGVGEETRSSKALPDIKALQAQRDAEF
jgi:hypothetical protein